MAIQTLIDELRSLFRAKANANFSNLDQRATAAADAVTSLNSIVAGKQAVIAPIVSGKLLGRSAAGSGGIEQISVGTGLTLASGALSGSIDLTQSGIALTTAQKTNLAANANLIRTPQMYGAVGDGTTDDTAAIQSAVNAIITGAAAAIYFPRGTYKITSAITVPFSTGWRIFGESRGKTIIKQFTANTPIFDLTTSLTHSWHISDLSFDYNTQQSAANTLAVAIYFSGSAGAEQTYFNFQIERCAFTNSYRGIASKSGSGTITVWGITVRNCTFGGTMTGAGVALVPTPSIGQPRITINECYFDCSAATEAAIIIAVGDNVTLQDVEFNNGTYTTFSQISITSSSAVTLINVKSEVATLNRPGNSITLWSLSDCPAVLISCSINGITVTATTEAFLIQANAGGSLSVIGFSVVGTFTGTTYVFDATTFNFLSSFTKDPSGNCLEVPNYGTIVPAKLMVDRLQANAQTARGDVSVTLTSASTKYQYFNTTLTADRTVTLPSSGVTEGMEFRIVRYAGGAFTLTASDPLSAKNYTLAANTKGFAWYRANGTSEWVLMSAGTFP